MRILLTLLMFITACAQSLGQSNYLTSAEIDSLRINEILFHELENTKGNVALLKEFFGVPKEIINREGGMEENWRSIEFDDITISFNNVDLTEFQPYIYFINAKSISFKGRTLSIGDPITNLGSDIIFNLNKDNSTSVLIDWGSCCNFIIEFDQTSKLVTKITYHVWT